jgi:hypothetical protein
MEAPLSLSATGQPNVTGSTASRAPGTIVLFGGTGMRQEVASTISLTVRNCVMGMEQSA